MIYQKKCIKPMGTMSTFRDEPSSPANVSPTADRLVGGAPLSLAPRPRDVVPRAQMSSGNEIPKSWVSGCLW